ncbi:MAG: hypothetical protein CMM25_06560 [Rhodospirillaceae bacterium]|nr:hypothetical protein [Rhodospirillaceae bacterium]
MAITTKKNGMQSSDYALNSDTLVWWTTPILRRKCVGADSVNILLKKEILRRAELDAGLQKSNVGGWHSGEDLLTWRIPGIDKLQRWIVEAFNDLTAATSNNQKFHGKLELNAWANLNRKGDYNSVHTHPACVWSGVYYVESGDPPNMDYPKSGSLELLDPRAGTEMSAIPGALAGMQKNIHPSSGEIIVFPSWLKHHVHPYFGTGNRISIAFNVRIRNKNQ